MLDPKSTEESQDYDPKCGLRQAVVTQQGVRSEVLAAVRMLLAPRERLSPNVTRAAFEQPAEPAEEARVTEVRARGSD